MVISKDSINTSTSLLGLERSCRLKTKAGLDETLKVVTNETFVSVFKEEGAKVISEYIKGKYDLGSGDFLNRCKVFSDSLTELLTSAGPLIETLILRNLFAKLELDFVEKKEYHFVDYLRELDRKVV